MYLAFCNEGLVGLTEMYYKTLATASLQVWICNVGIVACSGFVGNSLKQNLQFWVLNHPAEACVYWNHGEF